MLSYFSFHNFIFHSFLPQFLFFTCCSHNFSLISYLNYTLMFYPSTISFTSSLSFFATFFSVSSFSTLHPFNHLFSLFSLHFAPFYLLLFLPRTSFHFFKHLFLALQLFLTDWVEILGSFNFMLKLKSKLKKRSLRTTS